MGGAVSAGRSNDELIDNLIEAGYIEREHIERVFKCVDRGFYLTPREQREAYKDLAWRNGNLHLSAPCIYAKVLEALELQSGCSFLNIGSGTGYLSTMAGLLIGAHGVNHGIELHERVVDYAQRKLVDFVDRSDAIHEFEICAPQFVSGNALLIEPGRLYSRVYCGAAVTSEHEPFLRNLLSVGGVLVMPLRDQLVRVTRVSDNEWTSKTLLPVSFASLVQPTVEESTQLVKLPDAKFPTLCELCRVCIRSAIREHVRNEVPKWTSHVTVYREQKASESASASRSDSQSASTSPSGEHRNGNGETEEEEEADEDDADESHRGRKRGCFGILPFRSRHSRSSKSAAASTSASAASESKATETSPQSNASNSWRTPRVSGVQFTVNGAPRRFIRITLPGSSYFFEQPSSRSNETEREQDGENERQQVPDGDDDAPDASAERSADGALEQVINELFVEPRDPANGVREHMDTEGDLSHAEHEDQVAAAGNSHDNGQLGEESENEPDMDIFPRLVWRLERPPQRNNREADLIGDPTEDDKAADAEIVLPDYFGEKRETACFRTLMRAAVQQLSLPASLKNFLMFERRVPHLSSCSSNDPAPTSPPAKAQSDANDDSMV